VNSDEVLFPLLLPFLLLLGSNYLDSISQTYDKHSTLKCVSRVFATTLALFNAQMLNDFVFHITDAASHMQ